MKCVLSLSAVLMVALLSFAQQKPARRATSAGKPIEDSQVYLNGAFGFRYRVPYGWVDRTKEMQQGNDAGTGEVLLAIFERPPQAEGESVNSAVIIATEKTSSYPGLKSAEDYLGPLAELTTSKGFKADGDPQIIEIDRRSLVRADFTKPLNDKITMHQSTLVMLAKKQILSFTFVAGSEDEINDLVDALTFGPQSKSKK